MANEKMNRAEFIKKYASQIRDVYCPDLLEEIRNYGPPEQKHDDVMFAFSYSMEALLELQYVPSWIHRMCNWLRSKFPNGPLIQL